MSELPIDPVCGMEVKEEEAAGKTEYKGDTYYFCATACQEKFEENPGKFVGSESKGCGC